MTFPLRDYNRLEREYARRLGLPEPSFKDTLEAWVAGEDLIVRIGRMATREQLIAAIERMQEERKSA